MPIDQNTFEAVPLSGGKLVYTIREAALLLSMSETSVHRLINDQRLRRVPNFYRVLISGDELKRFAKARE